MTAHSPRPASQPTPAPADPTATRAAREAWLNTHCYGCGEILATPLDQITEANQLTANIEHTRCF